MSVLKAATCHNDEISTSFRSGALSSGIIPFSAPVTVTNGGSIDDFYAMNLSRSSTASRTGCLVLRGFKPFPAFNSIGLYQFTGTSTYHSLQATLSHNGRNFQYFATYTFGKALGTVATAESDGAAWADPIDTRNRSWGVLPFDRTHVFNLSYNWSVPRLARGVSPIRSREASSTVGRSQESPLFKAELRFA